MIGRKKSPRLVSYALVPALAVLTTWLTGFLYTAIMPDGNAGYGLPLPWKTVLFLPTCNGCPLPTYYNWEFFLLDSLFYAGIYYSIITAYYVSRGRRSSPERETVISFVLVSEK